MGAGDGDEEHDSDETPRMRSIGYDFDFATKEVTVEQFLQYQKEFVRVPNKNSPDLTGPANVVTWLEAIGYCRWVSEQEGISTEEMCYPPKEEIKEGMRLDPELLKKTGFRLPTDAEWEYAARAKAVTSRAFGDDPGMLDRHAWFIENARGFAHPVGLLLPNDFGVFDALGNVREWCQDAYRPGPFTLGGEGRSPFDPKVHRVCAGQATPMAPISSVSPIASIRRPTAGVSRSGSALRGRPPRVPPDAPV